jgi:hypothetical protein
MPRPGESRTVPLTERNSTMNGRQRFTHTRRLSLVILFAALAVASTASARGTGGFPLGKLCGSVSGATWKYQGQQGNRYNVAALSTKSCASALKAVGALTRQKPHSGALGPRTLKGPSGFQCVASGIISPSSAGFCGGSNGARFFWAPRVKS